LEVKSVQGPACRHTSDSGVIVIAGQRTTPLSGLDNAHTELLTPAIREAGGQPPPIGNFMIG